MCGALRVSSTDSAAAEGPRTSRARIRAKTKATPAANLQERRKLRVPALCSRGSGFSRELLILVNASKKPLLRPLPQERQAYGETPSGVRLKRLWIRSEEHTSELQSLMRISYAVFCLKKKK